MSTAVTANGAAPRVLFLYLQTTGAGHKSAAEAVAAALRLRQPEATTRAVNIADYMSDTVRQIYHATRALLIQRAPHVLGQLYAWSDGRRRRGSLFDRLLYGSERGAFWRLLRELDASRWEAVVHTHFFSPAVLTELRQKSAKLPPEFLVTTDFMTHRVWAHPACARTFVATDEALEYLAHLGVPRARLHCSGIPVHPHFAQRRLAVPAFAERTAARAAELASGDPPRITLMSTGFDGEFAANVLTQLMGCERPLAVLTVAGNSPERLRALNAVGVPRRHRVERLGHTSEVPAILAGSDLLIGKAGGLTSSEALAIGCPSLIVNPTPDHESQNTAWLLEQGAALMGHHPPLVRTKVEELFAAPERWIAMRGAAYRLGRAEAAFEIADQVLARIEEQKMRPDVRRASRAGGARAVSP